MEVGRAILASTISLTTATAVTVAALLTVALATLLRGEARVLAKHCASRKRVPLERAVKSAALARAAAGRRDGGAEGAAGAQGGDAKEGATYAVPLSRALAGMPARCAGEPLHLVGRSFSIRAAPHVYGDLLLLAELGSAHVELKPEHLALAEADGVFECVRFAPPPAPAPPRIEFAHSILTANPH